jgi:hypothetical protein
MPRGIYIRTKEHKQNISLSLIGNKRSLGFHHTIEARKKIKEARKKRLPITKETSKLMSEAQKQRYKERPMLKKTKIKLSKNKEYLKGNKHLLGHHHSEETKNKISLGGIRAYKEGKHKEESGGFKKFKRGQFYSIKNNRYLHYRSSWELQAYQIFEQINKIVTYEPEPFLIEYISIDNKQRNYIPDVLITYDDLSKELIEIKPKCFLSEPTNVLKFAAGKKFAEQNNMKFIIYTEENLNQLQKAA